MNTFKVVVAFTTATVVIFFLYPILMLMAFGAGGLFSAITDGSFLESLEVTFVIATATAVIAVVFGTPFAYLLARYDFRFKAIVDTVIDIPIMIPHTIVGVMIILAFASTSGLGRYLSLIGITPIDTLTGAVLAVTYLSSTYTIRVVESAIKTISPDVELTARSLGARPMFVFMHVVVPRIRRDIANGAMLAWARAVAETGALFIVAYYVYFNGHLVYPASIFVYESYVGIGLSDAVRYSAALVVVVLVVFVAFRLVLRRAQRYEGRDGTITEAA
jgi:molybdate/tungstate transport system permease protein